MKQMLKKAQMNINKTLTVGYVLIGIAVLFQIITAVLPTVTTAGDNLSTQGGLFGLFAGGGVLFTIIAVVVLAKVFRSLGGGR